MIEIKGFFTVRSFWQMFGTTIANKRNGFKFYLIYLLVQAANEPLFEFVLRLEWQNWVRNVH